MASARRMRTTALATRVWRRRRAPRRPLELSRCNAPGPALMHRRADGAASPGETSHDSSDLISVKDRDAFWTAYVIDPVAIPLVRGASRFAWITPNRLTALSAIVALASACAFGV